MAAELGRSSRPEASLPRFSLLGGALEEEEWVRSFAAPGGAIYSREEAGGDLSRSWSMRARAPATYAALAWLLAGERTRASRSINCGRRRLGEEEDAPHPQCRHGQNMASMTRRPSRPSPARARAPDGLRVNQEASRHAWTSNRGKGAGGRDGSSTGAAQRTATAMPGPCSPRYLTLHGHDGPATLSGVSTIVPSPHLRSWFGQKWTEMRGRISYRF